MIDTFFALITKLIITANVSRGIAPHTAHLSHADRLEYSYYMVDAGEEVGVDPFLIAAVMWHESRFLNLPRNKTNDYGLMQVHWQKMPVPWLKGLTRGDLLDPRTNILAGARELAHMRSFCRGADGRHPGHEWWGHYKYGVVVLGNQYGQTVLWRQKALRRRSVRPAS